MSVASSNVVDYLRQQLAGRYRVERELGAGGMAVVFLAHDLKHDRRVAIKVMRPEVSLLLGAERFLREIRIAAQLHHPGIVGLYDSGDAGNGLLYYVMPFEEGQTLRERLEAGALPLADALRIGQELADALAYAHEQQVVHRDIKPENILLLPHGHAAIADFGIARALAGAEVARTSSSGQIGSPAYMSPEQFSGASEVGPQSDIYALGCVVFEMLTGSAPYAGPDLDALRSGHCTADVPTVRSRRREVPLAVDLAVRRALSKRPEERFARAGEFGEALRFPELRASNVARAAARWLRRHAVPVGATAVLAAALIVWASVPAGDGHDSGRLGVAVSYFSAESALRRDADRIAEALTDDLVRIRDLTVTPAADLRALRDRSATGLREALGVDEVVTGTIVRADTGFRLSLAVVDAAAAQILATTRDSVATAGGGTDALVRRLGVFVRRALADHLDSLKRRTRFRRDEAWRLTEQSRGAVAATFAAVRAGAGRRAALAMNRADSLLMAAAAAEPDAALPRVLLARNRDRRAFVVEYLRQAMPDTAPFLPDPLVIRRSALPLLDSVLARDSNTVEALVLRGSVQAGLYRLGGPASLLASAISDLERATELDARNPAAWSELAWCYGEAFQYAEQLYAYQQALQVDLFQVTREVYLRGTFDAAIAAGQFTRADDACRTGLREFPEDERFRDCELKWLARTGSSAAAAARAVALVDSLAPLESNATARALLHIFTAQVLARAGRGADAERQARLGETQVPAPVREPFLLVELAAVRLLRQDPDSALALVRRAVLGSPNIRQHLLGDPRFRALRARLAGLVTDAARP